MKIAVTYENGEVFQHFGKTESFKVYETENGKVVSEEIIATNGTGHEALADFLAELDVDAVICGGIGDGAKDALSYEGIEIFAGVHGNADEAVKALLGGSLQSVPGATCDHHHDEEEEHCCCGHHHEEEECGCCDDDDCDCCDDECDGECGGDCSCCHSMPAIEGPNVGKICRTHYRGTFNDGTEFDSSYNRNEPLEFVCGAGMMIRGFDEAVAKMNVGETVNIHLMPDEAYGYADPRAVFTFEIAQLRGCEELNVGDTAYLHDNMGRPLQVRVTAKDEKNITLDANHQMAGKELNFQIELVEVK